MDIPGHSVRRAELRDSVLEFRMVTIIPRDPSKTKDNMSIYRQLQHKNMAHSVSNRRIWLLWQAQDAFQVNVKADMLRIWYGKIEYRVT